MPVFCKNVANGSKILRVTDSCTFGNGFQFHEQRISVRTAMDMETMGHVFNSPKVVNYVKEVEVIYMNTLRKGKKCVPLRRFKSGLWPNGCNELIEWL